jgi:prevent-host-death family protein
MAEVEHKGQHILIERRGIPIAALVSVEDLERLEAEVPASSDLPLDSLEIEGAWEDVGDAVIDARVDVIYKARDANTGRDVDLGL